MFLTPRMVIFFLLSISTLVSSAHAEVQIMLTGEFGNRAIHKHVLKDFEGVWFAVCRKDDKDYLKQVNVIVEIGSDTDVSLGSVTTKKCDNTLFLVRQLEGLSNRDLPQFKISQTGNSTTLASTKISLTINKENLGDKNGFKLYVKHGGKKQKIYETPFIDESGWWKLIWAGDINQDGHPDFAIKTSHKYSSYQFRLFLSKHNGGTLVLHEAAMIYVATAM